MIIGHVATAVLLKKYFPEEEPLPLFVGSLFPDIGDKLIRYVRQIYEGRTLFHSFLGFGLTVGVLLVFSQRKTARSWALGYFLHLVCDMGGVVPWFYPIAHYDYPYSPYTYPQKVVHLFTRPKLAETALLLWAIYEVLKK